MMSIEKFVTRKNPETDILDLTGSNTNEVLPTPILSSCVNEFQKVIDIENVNNVLPTPILNSCVKESEQVIDIENVNKDSPTPILSSYANEKIIEIEDDNNPLQRAKES